MGIVIGSPLFGWLSDLLKIRSVLLKMGAILGLTSFSCILFAPLLQTYQLYVLLFIMGLSAASQVISFALTKDNNHPLTNSTANAFINMVAVIGGIILIPFIGKILDLNWHGIIHLGIKTYGQPTYQKSFAILLLCYLIATFVSFFFIKETHCKNSYKT